MTKTETRELLAPYFRGRMFRGKKVDEYRQTQALLLIGAIHEMRTQAKLMDEGNEMAQMMAEFCRHRERLLVSLLRKA